MHHGRVVKRTGDGSLVEFRSVVDAVRCAIEVQNGMVERNAGLPPERRIEVRVGIHLGDVVEESDGDLMGDGVNIAARLEGIAKPGERGDGSTVALDRGARVVFATRLSAHKFVPAAGTEFSGRDGDAVLGLRLNVAEAEEDWQFSLGSLIGRALNGGQQEARGVGATPHRRVRRPRNRCVARSDIS